MNHSLSLAKKNTSIWQDYQEAKAHTAMLFPTEGAKALGVSEFELMLASPYSQYMGGSCREVLKQFEHCDEVESIVRNALAVHEKTALYNNLKLGDKMGLALNVGGLDLRFFMWRWKHMLAVTDTSNPDKPSYSIQFYDEQGAAIDKVYLRELNEDNIARWQAIVEKQTESVVKDEVTLDAAEAVSDWNYKALDDEQRAQLHEGWKSMTDVHQFHGLLKTLDIDRASSYCQAPQGMAYPLGLNAIAATFEAARDSQCPIMIFVGNSGIVQIQTGTVQTLKRINDWFNILDKKHNNFTLHLKDRAMAQVWCVKRPTKDGIVTCIEGFDNQGVSVFSIFGQRMEGTPELEAWQKITTDMINNHPKNVSDNDVLISA